MVLQILYKKTWRKNFAKFVITNPVVGCCQSTLKECRSYFQYMRFVSTGGALRASIFLTNLSVFFLPCKCVQDRRLVGIALLFVYSLLS